MLKRIFWRISFLTILFLTIFALACVPSQKELRAYMLEPSPDWMLVEKCGYQGCNPIVDFLQGKGLSLRLEGDNDWQTKQFFTISISFASAPEHLTCNPSAISVKLSSGEVLKPKAFTCSYTPTILSYLRSNPSLEGWLSTKNACYRLFFDHPVIAVDEDITIYLNDVLKLNNEALEVPPIVFKKNPLFDEPEQIKSYFH